MKLTEWASIAEITSGGAVVITLVFLILGIRENTLITRASMFDSTMEGMADFRSQIVNSQEVADLWEAYLGMHADSIDSPGRIRMRELVMMLFENYQRAYYASQYGVLGPSEWSRFEAAMCEQYPRAVTSEYLSLAIPFVLTEEFRNFLATTCDVPQQNELIGGTEE